MVLVETSLGKTKCGAFWAGVKENVSEIASYRYCVSPMRNFVNKNHIAIVITRCFDFQYLTLMTHTP